MNSISFNGLYLKKAAPVNPEARKRNIKKAVAITAGTAIVAGSAVLYANRKSDKVQQFFNNFKSKAAQIIENLKAKKSITAGEPDKPQLKELPDKVIDKAKENVKNLRLAGASVAAGGSVALLTDNLIEENEEENEKLTIKYNNKKFKGEFRDGKAYDENNNLFTGKLLVTYKDEDDTVKKTEITYKDGILARAVRFDGDKSEIDWNEIPVFVKDYKNGYINKQYLDLVKSENGSRGLVSQKILQYNIEEDSPFPMLCIEKTFDKSGTETENKIYKRNLDDAGNIAGKPIHKWTAEFETLPDGTKRNTFYPAEFQDFEDEGVVDKSFFHKPVKIVDAKPDGTTEVTLMSREGYPLGKMSLDKNGKAVSYRLVVESEDDDYTGKLDGVIRLKDGKIKGMNDFISVLATLQKVYAPPKPVELDSPKLSEIKTKEKNRAFAQKLTYLAQAQCRLNETSNYNEGDIDKMFSSTHSTKKIGIRYNDNGTVRAIALYSSFDDFPDCVTLFNDDGTPQKDINYDGYGMRQSFSPVYKVRSSK